MAVRTHSELIIALANLIVAFAWFSIPLGLCATMSFVAVVLQDTEYWPASGGVTGYQINNALILPLAAQAIMGTGGVVAIILMVCSMQYSSRCRN